MKKAWKKLLAWVLPCTLLITGTGFPSAVADDAGEVSRKVILSTDFEDETADPWQAGLDGVYAAYSFTDQAKNGQKALKAERKSGQLVNRSQAQLLCENGQFEEGRFYDFSFWIKTDTASTVTAAVILQLSNGSDKTITLVNGEETGTAWREMACGFEASVTADGALACRWKRPDTGILTQNLSTGLPAGTTVTGIWLLIYSDCQTMYLDDILVDTAARSTDLATVSKTILHSDFETDATGPWKAGLDNSYATFRPTSDAAVGSGALKSVRNGGQTNNRIQTMFEAGSRPGQLENGKWTNIDYWMKGDNGGKVDTVAAIYLSDGTDKTVLLASETLRDTWQKFHAGLEVTLNADGALYARWQRPDTGLLLQQLASLPAGTTITGIYLIFYGPVQTLYMDDIHLYTEEQVTLAAKAVMEQIDAIGTITPNSDTEITAAEEAYEVLSETDKKMVVNVHKLTAARRTWRLLNGMPAVDFDEENILFSFGAVSDTHNNNANVPRALRILAEHATGGLDAIVSAGDLTEGVVYAHTTHEIPQVRDTFLENVDDAVDIFFCLGNHDSSAGSGAALFYDTLGERFYRADLDKNLARTTGNRHAVLGGYHFLAVEANYQTEDYDAATLDWVEQTLQSVVSAPDYDGRQIFVLTHFAPNDTVFGCIGSTGLSNILRDYPQAVLLTGHSHYSIYDERAIMQTDFTTLNLGSVSYMGLPAGYVESTHSGLIEESYTLSVGTLVEIDRYGNLRITRIDFTQDEIIKQPWIIPAPAEDRSHLLYYPQERGTLLNEAPAFAGTAKFQAFLSEDKEQLTLNFDHADDDDMVYAYQIALYQDGSAEAERLYKSTSGFYHYPQSGDWPEQHTVTVTGLDAVPYQVQITPLDSWGKAGHPLTLTVSGNEPLPPKPAKPEEPGTPDKPPEHVTGQRTLLPLALAAGLTAITAGLLSVIPRRRRVRK